METVIGLFPGLALASFLLAVVLGGVAYKVLGIQDNSTVSDSMSSIGVLAVVGSFFSICVCLMFSVSWFVTSR